jgi:DNA-binding beta-propeller fold protein YncE
MSGWWRGLMGSVFLAAAGSAQADILVGNFGNTSVAQRLQGFADNANGNAAPIRRIGGSLATALTPVYPTYDAQAEVIYVADFYGQRVSVFPLAANGDVPAPRSFTSPIMGQPRSVAVDPVHDEVLMVVSNCCVASFPRNASGAVAAIRSIQWGGSAGSLTGLDNPGQLIYLPATDEVAVSDYRNIAGGGSAGEILIFPRIASGNAAPTRIISGAATRLDNYAGRMAYDAARNELYVVATTQDVGGNVDRIVTFDANANGNAMPLRVIEGANAGLINVGGLAFDAGHDLLYVVNGSYNAVPAILAFPRLANGNVSPLRSITGAATGLDSPAGIEVVPDRVMRNGFE